MKLCEAEEWHGEWWVPEEPEYKQLGTLNYDGAGRLELSVAGSFIARRQQREHPGVYIETSREETFDTVYGNINGERFTLFGASYFSERGSGGQKREVYDIEKAVKGGQIESAEARVFDQMWVSFENLHLMAGTQQTYGIDGVLTHLGESSSVKVQSSTQIACQKFRILQFYNPSKPLTRGTSCAESSALEYTIELLDEGKFSVSQAIRDIKRLQELIILATQSRAGVIQVNLREARDMKPHESIDQESPGLSLLYRCPQIGDTNVTPIKTALINCNELEFHELVAKWLQEYDNFSNTIKLLTALFSDEPGHLQQRVITVVTAAEALSSRLANAPTPFAEDEFNELREKLLHAVDSKYRPWVKRTLRNRPDLRERLIALIENLHQSVVQALLPDSRTWARKAVNARNDLAHEGKARNLDAIELYAIVRYTTVLVSLLIANRLDVPRAVQRRFAETQRNSDWDAYFTEAHRPSASES